MNRLQAEVVDWFEKRREEVSLHADNVITRVESITEIAQLQTKLSEICVGYGDLSALEIWKRIMSRTTYSNCSMFEILFGDSIRKKTRSLVHSSFVDALEGIKNEVNSSLEECLVDNTIDQLTCIRFYQFFDDIHKTVEGLDASELHRVLMEEYLRTLLKFVNFLETQYSWVNCERGSVTGGMPLVISNILMAIVTEFPTRIKVVIGNAASDPSDLASNLALARSLEVFDQFADRGFMQKQHMGSALKELQAHDPDKTPSFIDDDLSEFNSLGPYSFFLLGNIRRGVPFSQTFVSVLEGLATKYCEEWARALLCERIQPLRSTLQLERYDLSNEEWMTSHLGWSEHTVGLDGDFSDDDGNGSVVSENVWLPWCETTTVSSFLFSCCYALDEAYRLVKNSKTTTPSQVRRMHGLIRSVLVEQLTITSVDVYDEAVSLIVQAKAEQSLSVLNFGEYPMLQFLFDMYFVRATLGFSDFIRFGWGDEIDRATCAPSLSRLIQLFDRMRDFIDPVDWEIYGPQLIENVVVQFRKSRLLFSSLSESSDINEINGKAITVSAQDTRPIVKVVDPVPRFSLLPVPTTKRRAQREVDGSTAAYTRPSRTDSALRDTQSSSSASQAALPALKLQNILSSSASSNILSAAATGSTLLSSAAKGMSFLSSATTSYLREGSERTAAADSNSSRSGYF
ncbi:hypothetical protein PINS_up001723 [Pythium insidiosum]|nr:hypothetical protein PINS_up001723 [Pythium insidiosum]